MQGSLSMPAPLLLDLARFQCLLKERDDELSAAQSEIKGLRVSEALKEKVLVELKAECSNLDEKLRTAENIVQQKNLEMKKLSDEKNEALAAQFAAEAALLKLHTTPKDDDSPQIEAIIAPLEADIKFYKNEVSSLIENNKALERLTKSKEAALLETEKILRSALDRTSIVEDIQNQNFELKRQVEICQEEIRILEKTNRQKVLEVEKLSQTIQELEEAVLAGGASANVIRDYKRQISRLNEEKRILEREVARAKVSVNRVASVVANEWKNEDDKVMPVRQYLEERKVFQAEIQRLKEKLSVIERTAKAEAQLKEKLKLRLKTVEEGLMHANLRHIGSPKSPKLWKKDTGLEDMKTKEGSEDVVSGFLYDKLQKEVISLRKICREKDSGLCDKDDEIKGLQRKVDVLAKSIEVEARKGKKETSVRAKKSS